jgi:putative ABC transport system permease protein
MLKLVNIVKEYPTGDSKVTALKGVNIEFRKNEFVSILGPSGCGKTTMLNIIGGLDSYTSGDLIITGKSTKDFNDRDWDTYRNRSIGFVFQSYNLIAHQTVLSNVELAMTLSGVSKSERKARAVEALEKVGLGDQIHKKPNQLSGGQMQRVAIARALVNNPEILLADEPTGALDSVTSLQIMELLREIAKDRLVIMVTHNPDIAEHYSTRIIKLLDGQVTDDTNSYESPVVEEAPKKKVKRSRRKKTSMSFFTALSLSLNNLMTKKTRTFMTAFAGSIGIIGIALILSLSNGVQEYINSVQEDTLSSYPLSIEHKSVDYGALISTMMDAHKGDAEEHDKEKVYSNNIMGKMLNSMVSDVTINNLEAFKAYIEGEGSGISDYVSDIQYSYDTPLNIYKPDTSKGIIQVNPSKLLEGMGENMGGGGGNSGFSSSMSNADVWVQMIGNKDLLEKQYDVIYGHMPESYDQVVLIVNENNEVSDYALYALGLLDQNELKDMFADVMEGKEVTSNSVSYSYEELTSLSFKMIVNSDYFEKTETGWRDRSADEEYMKKVIANGMDVKVVGILRPSEESVATSANGSIGYTADLMTNLINRVNDSEIVKEQLANPDTDVFTGITFPTEEDKAQEKLTMDMLTAYIATLPAEQQAQYAATIQQMKDGGMGDDAIAAMFASAMGKGSTDATYEDNLEILGVSDLKKPALINLYPRDFASKDKIEELIAAYNEGVAEEDRIQYTDYVGLMMSSIKTIINAISYILIAFVAISLVVSSIMIGIITYISVLERTKEIGILRAIGASKKDISRVFNAETLIEGFVAGAIGIGITLLLTLPINAIIKSITDISGLAALPLAGGVALIIISMFLTFIAGLIPSRIAAKKDPVVALRSE